MKAFSNVIHNPLLKTIFVIVFGFSIFAVCSTSTAKLSDVTICTSLNSKGECENSVSTVPADAPKVYCSANLKNAPDDTKVTFTWEYNGSKIASADVKSGSAVINSAFTPTGTLPAGTYTVTAKIDSDNSEPVKKEFKVE